MESSKVGAGEILLYVLSGVCVAYGFWKACIDGYYQSEIPLVFGALVIGAVLLFIAGRISAQRKRLAAQAADRERGVE